MVNTLMLLQMISALDALEKLIPEEKDDKYAVKQKEWDDLGGEGSK